MLECGIIEDRDQSRLTEGVLMVLLPLILPHVPADRQPALLTDLEAARTRPVIDVTPEHLTNAQHIAAPVLLPPPPPVVFQTDAHIKDYH